MKSPLILIVEDEFIIAEHIRSILTDEGYDCINEMTTYQEAVAGIEEYHPDLVIIDIMLFGTHDGLKIGAYLHEKAEIPYLYLTSLSDKETVMNVKHTFPYGYIVKPFKPEDVLTNVALVLNNFRHRNLDFNRAGTTQDRNDIPYQLRLAINYINDNINEKISVPDLVKITRWKLHHFIRIFDRYLNVTPNQYIIQCKIERSIHLFKTTSLSASDIAFELGFNSYSNFSKMFKKTKGITIEEYKRKYILTGQNALSPNPKLNE